MAFSRCKFCGDSGVFPFPVVSKKGVTEYFRCKECMAISLSDKEHLPLSQQLARYRQHNNNLNDFGYAHFLTSFVYHTFSFLAPFAPSSILDYGCGPNPALIDLLHLVLKRQQDHGSFTKSTDFNGIDSVEKCIDFLAFFLSYLPKQELIYGWDPFFSPNGKMERKSVGEQMFPVSGKNESEPGQQKCNCHHERSDFTDHTANQPGGTIDGCSKKLPDGSA